MTYRGTIGFDTYEIPIPLSHHAMSQGAAALRGTAAAGAGTAAWEDVDGVTSRGGAGADFGWGSK